MANNAKTNLVIDFNNMAFRAMFMCIYSPEYKVSTFDTQEENNEFICKLVTDISYIVRMFKPDRTIIACDSNQAWRKDLFEDLPGEKYKGTREKDDKKNWTMIFDNLGELKEALDKYGFFVNDVPRAEADDLAALWKEKCMREGDNLILISSDKDWLQLADFNPNFNNYCSIFNPIPNQKTRIKTMYGTQGFVDWLNKSESGNDIFFTNYDPHKDFLKKLLTSDRFINYNVIDPMETLMGKIMCGDDGDNVPSFYQFYKNATKVRVTPNRAKKIEDLANAHNVTELVEAASNGKLLEAMNSVLKYNVDVDMTQRLQRQRLFVELNSALFPESIVTVFNKQMKRDVDKGFIVPDNCKVNTILDGTKFLEHIDRTRGTRIASIFSDLKEIDFILDDLKEDKASKKIKKGGFDFTQSENISDQLF